MATDTKTNLFCDASLLVRRGDAGRAAPLAASRLLITAGGWRSGLRARHEMSYHSKHLWKSVSLSDSAGPTRQARIQATKAEQARGRILDRFSPRFGDASAWIMWQLLRRRDDPFDKTH